MVGVVVAVYLGLFGLAFWNIQQYNKQLTQYESVKKNHELKIIEQKKITKELGIITRSLELSKSIKSNKKINYRILAQVASSVPKRVRFQKLIYVN